MSRKSTSKRVETIQRRIDFLDKRIKANPDKDLSFDKQESSSLKWALHIIDLWYAQNGERDE